MQRLSGARTVAPFRGAPAVSAVSRPRTVCVKAAVAAAPASVPVKTVDGADAGTEQLALKVARPETAKGLVHRYVVFTLQNRRRVSQLCMLEQFRAITRPTAPGLGLLLPLLLPLLLLHHLTMPALLFDVCRCCTGHSQHSDQE